MSLEEQRKQKNAELKNRVKQITGGGATKAIMPPTQNDAISTVSSKDSNFFITGANVKMHTNKSKNKATYKNVEEPGSPTTRAAQALAILNKTDDTELEAEIYDEDRNNYKNPAD